MRESKSLNAGVWLGGALCLGIIFMPLVAAIRVGCDNGNGGKEGLFPKTGWEKVDDIHSYLMEERESLMREQEGLRRRVEELEDRLGEEYSEPAAVDSGK